MHRRTALVAGFAVTLALPGCLDRSASTDSETTTPTGSAEPTGTPVPATRTSSTATESTSTTTAEETTTPEPNRTPYPVVWQWDVREYPYPLGETVPKVVLLTIDEWQNTVNDAALSAEAWSFLSETDFGSETVIASHTSVSAGLNRLILHSVEGVGTSTITLTVEEWESGSGLNNAPLHLMLVRIPNRGMEPEKAVVTAPSGTGTLTSND